LWGTSEGLVCCRLIVKRERERECACVLCVMKKLEIGLG
jgi:hypothetical protein